MFGTELSTTSWPVSVLGAMKSWFYREMVKEGKHTHITSGCKDDSVKTRTQVVAFAPFHVKINASCNFKVAIGHESENVEEIDSLAISHIRTLIGLCSRL